jgi:hypothetical protein
MPESDKAVVNLSDVEKHRDRLKKSKRDEQLDRLHNQKLRLQNDEAKARTSYMKNLYSGESSGGYTPRNVPKRNLKTSKADSGDDIEIL